MKLIPNDCTHHMALTMPNGLDCLVKIMPTDDQYEVMVLVTSGDQAGIVDYRWRVDAGAGVQFYDAYGVEIQDGPDYDFNQTILIRLRANPKPLAEVDWWLNAHSAGFTISVQ